MKLLILLSTLFLCLPDDAFSTLPASASLEQEAAAEEAHMHALEVALTRAARWLSNMLKQERYCTLNVIVRISHSTMLALFYFKIAEVSERLAMHMKQA